IMAGGQPPQQKHNYFRFAGFGVFPSQVEKTFFMVGVFGFSFTQLTLPAKRGEEVSGGAGALKKKK
ncbi:hypothetical protein JQN32_25945, partial [Escherichia coli]|nr:hypothetical protein [Escherichia coli]